MSHEIADMNDEEAAGMLNDLTNALQTFFRFSGYWDEAVQINTWAYTWMKRLACWQDAGWRAYDVAWIHYLRAETDQAASWAERAKAAWTHDSTKGNQAVSTHLLGLIAEQQGDPNKAEHCFKEALTSYRELGNVTNTSIALNDLGNSFFNREAYNQAENYYREALETAKKLGNTEIQAYVSANLGSIGLNQNQPETARLWFERSLALAQEIGRADLVASAQYGLAFIMEKEGRFAEALSLAEAALAIRERLRERYLESAQDLVVRLRKKLGQ